MIFYYAPKTVSLATHIALEETGANYEARRLDFSITEQRSAEYLGINPKGRVPSLATDEGILTETPALLAYLAQAFPAARLGPIENPFLFAKMQEFNCYLCATVHVAHAHRVRGVRWVDDPVAIEALKVKVPQNMAECFQLIEDGMLQGPWVMGAEYSVSDGYLFTVAQWLASDGVDIADFPRVAEHAERMLQRAAVQKVLPLYQV
jgi:glutathione S-transferase